MTARPRLRVDAKGFEVVALREVLARFAREAPEAFAALFAPVGPMAAVRGVAPEIAYVLSGFGLVDDAGGDRLVGRMRVRRLGERFYVMALGGVSEYRQDVWPETDAMLAELAAAPRGRLLDMGTGSGIVAIEAAARGHRVVATDLYDTALGLARFNARLNGIGEGIDFRRGHLFEPVAGEQFDLVLTAPHYTRVADQLRLETLRTAPPFAAPAGRVVIATFLEWQGDGPLAAVETILAAHAAAGTDVTVRPLHATLKQGWFTVADPDGALSGLVSRHRFLVEMRQGSGRLHIERPQGEQVVRQRYVSLARVSVGGAAPAARRPAALAVVDDRPALAVLERLVDAAREGIVTLSGEVPTGLLDACRFGAGTCVTPQVIDGAAGAILDRDGGVRPCAHGGVVARVSDSMADVVRILGERAAAAAERRGCATCSAAPRCSRCLFPHALAEAEYCDRMRAWAPALPYLHRTLAMLASMGERPRPLSLKLRRTVPLVIAAGRPMAAPSLGEAFEAPLARLAARWSESGAIAVDGTRRPSLFVFGGGRTHGVTVAPFVAEVAELLGDGVHAGELRVYARDQRQPPAALDASLAAIARLLAQL